MINYNGTIVTSADIAIHNNRAFLYGDAIFETLKVLDGKVLFAEDHYFRLMASMRILRMEIPMTFTQEYMESQVTALIQLLPAAPSYRARITFYRNPGGKYLPTDNNSAFIITAEPLQSPLYSINEAPYEVELFRDYYVTKQLLSTLKTTNKAVHITAAIFADENGYNNCLLVNDDKNVIEATNGNLFMLTGNKLVTPALADGCLNGIMRKQVLALARKVEGYEVVEEPISPFDLQKADELFITNVITGIQPITKYRKKEYKQDFTQSLLKRLNAQIRFS
ncbi:aminotransferase class IV [Flavobacterium akiainvivens]|uniref:branched-chain-amino-acid transaminase n=1 Tax=Flavobacterium akiainvivens TaxID=1202724 RepID=A0A0M8MCU8_9FLAO|nr:aminotransferase class IV [Flavobacterium akiainvivens]KOS06134.1 aminotransferase class IV [Flavobacterium akiainvivens]SFQ67779.1 branched-chain amino acid aminotransferase [Flavobacterium akiainvivens]